LGLCLEEVRKSVSDERGDCDNSQIVNLCHLTKSRDGESNTEKVVILSEAKDLCTRPQRHKSAHPAPEKPRKFRRVRRSLTGECFEPPVNWPRCDPSMHHRESKKRRAFC
jgi:hypothetical protein